MELYFGEQYIYKEQKIVKAKPMSRIAEIKEKAVRLKEAGSWSNIKPQDVINLCEALEFAQRQLRVEHTFAQSYDEQNKEALAQIDRILQKSKDG